MVNTVTGDREILQDGFQIRRAAVDRRIPCFTSLDTARAAVESLVNGGGSYNVKPLPGVSDGALGAKTTERRMPVTRPLLVSFYLVGHGSG